MNVFKSRREMGRKVRLSSTTVRDLLGNSNFLEAILKDTKVGYAKEGL